MSQENTSSTDPAALAPPAADSSRPQSKVADGFKNRTKGEGLFNFVSYAGVGYFGVTIFSVFMTYLLRDFKPIAKHYTNLTEKIIHSNKGARTGGELKKFAETVDSNMTIGALFTGGTIMSVLPIKALEDHKAGIVKQFDRWLYGSDKVANDPSIQQAHAELDAAPKQTWKSVFGSRLLAFAATLGTSLAIGSSGSPLFKATGHSIDRHSARAGRWIDGALHHKNPGIVKEIDLARQAHPNSIYRGKEGPADRVNSRIWSYITLDGFYTMITGGALYVFTRLLAPVFDRHPEPKVGPAPVLAEPLAAAPARADAASERATTPETRIAGAETAGRLSAAPEQALAHQA